MVEVRARRSTFLSVQSSPLMQVSKITPKSKANSFACKTVPKSATRALSVWFPSWPITRLRISSPRSVPSFDPFVIVDCDRVSTISAVNNSARRAGIQIGMSLAIAEVAFPGLTTRPAEPKKDYCKLLRLARWARRYGPNSRCCGKDGLSIDITDRAHLFGGEPRLLDDIAEQFRTFDIPAHVAVADTPGAALALARHCWPENADWVMAPVGAARGVMEPLPVEGLCLDPRTTVLLKRLGIRRIGDLYEIPRNKLVRIFRSTLITREVLEHLDSALGVSTQSNRLLTDNSSLNRPSVICSQ